MTYMYNILCGWIRAIQWLFINYIIACVVSYSTLFIHYFYWKNYIYNMYTSKIPVKTKFYTCLMRYVWFTAYVFIGYYNITCYYMLLHLIPTHACMSWVQHYMLLHFRIRASCGNPWYT